MRLTNEQIEQYEKSPFGAVAMLAKELNKTRKELELSNSIQKAYREKSEKQSEYIKELERDAERGESGVNSV